MILGLRFCLALLAVSLPFATAAQQWGIQVRNTQGSAGAEVTFVNPGTPAETADIRPGDTIVRVQGRPVVSAFQFTQAAQSVPVGTGLTLTVLRLGWEREVHLPGLPSAPSFGLTLRDGPTGTGPAIASVVPGGSAFGDHHVAIRQ